MLNIIPNTDEAIDDRAAGRAVTTSSWPAALKVLTGTA